MIRHELSKETLLKLHDNIGRCFHSYKNRRFQLRRTATRHCSRSSMARAKQVPLPVFGMPNETSEQWATNWFKLLDDIASFVRNAKYEI